MPAPSPARPIADAINRRSQLMSSAVVISPRAVGMMSARSAKRCPCARTSGTSAPCRAAPANSCSTGCSSKVLVRSVRPSAPASRSPKARSSTPSRTARPFGGAFAARLQQLRYLLRAEPELACACSHLLAPGVRLEPVLLALARGERRALRGRLRAQPDPARLGLALHLVAARGEVLDHRPLHVGELGRAVVDLAPLETEALADERPQVRLIQRPRRLRCRVEQRAVQRGEATVGSPRQVPGDDMGVQLRVERTAHAMPVGSRDQTRRPPRRARRRGRGGPSPRCPRDTESAALTASSWQATRAPEVVLRRDREQNAHGLRRARTSGRTPRSSGPSRRSAAARWGLADRARRSAR